MADGGFEELKTYLESQGYTYICQSLRDSKVYALYPFIYTWGIVCNITGDEYEYRYCYGGLDEALPAMRDWQARGFEGHPVGYIKRKP